MCAAAREIENYREVTNVRNLQIQREIETAVISVLVGRRMDGVSGGTCSLGLIRDDKDLGYAPRLLRKNPGFSLAVTALMALST